MSRHCGVQTSTARKNHRSGHTEGRLTTTPSGCRVRKGIPCGHSACRREPFPVEAAPRVPQHSPDEGATTGTTHDARLHASERAGRPTPALPPWDETQQRPTWWTRAPAMRDKEARGSSAAVPRFAWWQESSGKCVRRCDEQADAGCVERVARNVGERRRRERDYRGRQGLRYGACRHARRDSSSDWTERSAMKDCLVIYERAEDGRGARTAPMLTGWSRWARHAPRWRHG
jgi:hypothetical protein